MALLRCSAVSQGVHLWTLPTKRGVSENVCYQPERLSQFTSSLGFIAM
jgi:hypothetical protein